MTTEKQQAFAMRLYQDLQKVAPNLSETDAATMAEVMGENKDEIAQVLQGEGDNRVASKAIDILKSLVDGAKEKSGIVEYRWAKLGDDWVVKGPNLSEGMEVTVVSRRGEQQVKIGNVSGEFGYPVREKIPTDIEEGVWLNNDGDYIQVAKTRNNQLVGKLIDPETGKRTYLGKRGLTNLDRKLTLDEAKAFGHKTGVCINCGRTLTDPVSVENGIGPICAAGGY